MESASPEADKSDSRSESITEDHSISSQKSAENRQKRGNVESKAKNQAKKKNLRKESPSDETSFVFNSHENKISSDDFIPKLPVTFSNLTKKRNHFLDQNFVSSLFEKDFKQACVETLRYLALQHKFVQLAWLERANKSFNTFFVTEKFASLSSSLNSSLKNENLHAAIARMTYEQVIKIPPFEIFPLSVGSDVRAAIVIADPVVSDIERGKVANFCQEIATSLEVLRLREELAARAKIVRAVQLFNEKLNAASGENVFNLLLQTCADLLEAERGSLLIYDEIKQQLKVEAAIGSSAATLKKAQIVSGERFAEQVYRTAAPIIVEDVELIGLPRANVNRGYRSKSFVSFPLAVGNRKIGVLNVTEKRSGTSYNQNDLKLLEAIAPQLAIAVDRAALEKRAGQLEQLSITDGLTGLLNRRYLNERLSEEVNRSQSNNLEMSFIMIDLDNFKRYNDRFGHQAGDEALKIVAQCLKANLRTADVAARYGGEEFSLLLPQTTLSEAHMIAERILQRVADTEFPHAKVTVSIGVAAYSPLLLNTPQAIVEAADKGLYEAKRVGKNNVQISLF